MRWPGIAEYNAAFADPDRCLLGPSLKGAKPKLGPFGIPLPLSGGFAYIYDVTIPSGARKAVRCFNADLPEQRNRAKAAIKELAELLGENPELRPWFVDIVWEDDCISAAGTKVPALVMDWIEGQTLGQYLEAMHHDGSALSILREKQAALVTSLSVHGIVHGDLQTGNIVIDKRGNPKLIDYDGMWFTSGGPPPAAESGHPNFQHPSWVAASDSGKKDSFPSIAIDLGLAALVARPDLFDIHSTGENVLFVRDDFEEPEYSAAFAAIRAIPELRVAADLFAGLCRSPIEILPSLEDFRIEASRARSSETAGAVLLAPAWEQVESKAQARARGPYVGAYQVFDAKNYRSISGAVGRKVEIVGRVLEVKHGITKYGLPYVFVNFSDWRNDCFKLSIWSEGLDTFANEPSASWAGKWISAVGLVDEPYRGARSYATQLSITIQDSSQVRFIDDAEARYRLGEAPATSFKDNTALLGSMGTKSAGNPNSAMAGKPSNADLVAKLSRTTASTPQRTSSAPNQGYQNRTPVPSKPDMGGVKALFTWALVIGGGLLLLRVCSL
ncbi:MAG: AarF/UbiB family protein [Rectinemataceae bacterium]